MTLDRSSAPPATFAPDPLILWVPAGNPRLTGIRVPAELQGKPMEQAAYLRRLSWRVQAMMDAVGEAETRRLLETLAPDAAWAVERAHLGEMAEVLFEMSDSLTGAMLAEQLSEAQWPEMPTAAPPSVAKAVAATTLRVWLCLAVPQEM